MEVKGVIRQEFWNIIDPYNFDGVVNSGLDSIELFL